MRVFPSLTLFAALLSFALPATADVPNVIADTPITQSLAAQVMGSLATPTLLLDQGGDPHHAQLRPSQARALSNADLLIWISADLSPWLASAIAAFTPTDTLELARVDGVHHQSFQTNVLLEQAHDEHDHDGHEDHEDHAGHDHDPHLWLNPENARVWLGAIAEQLAILDPENSATYTENALRAQADIDALHQEITTKLVGAQGAGLVVAHAAYGHFATAFNLTFLGSVAAGDAADPGAARLSMLRASLADAGAVCIFPEVNRSRAYVDLVAEGETLRVGAPMDPAGVTLEPGPDLYAQTMHGLARTIAECVAGD